MKGGKKIKMEIKKEREIKVFRFIVFLIIGVLIGVMIMTFLNSLDNWFLEKELEIKEAKLNLEWRNFVVVGDNIKIYIGGEEFVILDGSNRTFSWWMKTTGKVKKITFWDGTNDYINITKERG